MPRSVLLVPPGGAWHRVAAGGGADLAVAAFSKSVLDPELVGDNADGLLGMLGVGLSAVAPEPPIRVIRLPPDAFDEARSLFARLELETGQRRTGKETMQRLVLVELLMVVYRCSRAEEDTGSAGPARFRITEAEAWIRERYAEEISLPAIASRFGFNPSYFSRLFAARTGVHLTEYLNRVRIQKSCVFLKRSSLSIAEIAFSVGYSNRSHFNRYFRRIVGMSPREYRRMSKK